MDIDVADRRVFDKNNEYLYVFTRNKEKDGCNVT